MRPGRPADAGELQGAVPQEAEVSRTSLLPGAPVGRSWGRTVSQCFLHGAVPEGPGLLISPAAQCVTRHLEEFGGQREEATSLELPPAEITDPVGPPSSVRCRVPDARWRCPPQRTRGPVRLQSAALREPRTEAKVLGGPAARPCPQPSRRWKGRGRRSPSGLRVPPGSGPRSGPWKCSRGGGPQPGGVPHPRRGEAMLHGVAGAEPGGWTWGDPPY